ncbi:MAG: CpsD/CapB family tyrosine-protein kinase [Candidatus Latescibacteria bacterium]|nr:CpsD/CapB family tyrosine-protein kinase [Candidatus Latescibacterota bacterium]
MQSAFKIPLDDDRGRLHNRPGQEARDEDQVFSSHSYGDPGEKALVRATRPIVFNPIKGTGVDTDIVAFQFYDCFNYSLLGQERREVGLTVGVTSANPGEGKTLVASNLAVSLAIGYQRKAVLVDLNVRRPRLHDVFGTSLSPGLVDALDNSNGGTIHVSSTQIDGLSVLTAGLFRIGCLEGYVPYPYSHHFPVNHGPAIGLGRFTAFLDVLYTLTQEFEFIIVDMPSINTRDFPILFASRLDGLIAVVDAEKTKRKDVDQMFRQLNESQILGFVLNRV